VSVAEVLNDASPRGADDGRRCSWCRELLSTTRPARFCSRRCRQAAFRLRRRRTTELAQAAPGRFAYADPPYPGRAHRYYSDQPTFAGEVDHAALIASLAAANYTGWALSTAVDALRDLLPLCPREARVCAWVKPIAASPLTHGLHNTWEPLIVVGGRRLRPGKRDWLCAQPARFGGDLPGRKPIAFCAFLFDALGMLPGDELVDLFPGTGIVSKAWGEASSVARGLERRTSSVAEVLADASSTARANASPEYSCDGSRPGANDEGRAS
jgi:hypothetical protein